MSNKNNSKKEKIEKNRANNEEIKDKVKQNDHTTGVKAVGTEPLSVSTNESKIKTKVNNDSNDSKTNTQSLNLNSNGVKENDSITTKTVMEQNTNVVNIDSTASNKIENVMNELSLMNNVESTLNERIESTQLKTRTVLQKIVGYKGSYTYRTSPLTHESVIRKVSVIPRLLDIITIGSPINNVRSFDELPYLKASHEKFGFGIKEAKVILKSFGLIKEINLMTKQWKGEIGGIGAIKTSDLSDAKLKAETYVNIFVNIFLMADLSQVIITNVDTNLVETIPTMTHDYVSQRQMIGNKYIRQDVPILWSGGIGGWPDTVRKMILGMLQNPRHYAYYGRTENMSQDGIKYFDIYMAYTDQFFSKLNQIYIDYLNSRKASVSQLERIISRIAGPGINVRREDNYYEMTLYPIWKREECDGLLLLHASSATRRLEFIEIIMRQLEELNLLSFRSIEDMESLMQENLSDTFGSLMGSFHSRLSNEDIVNVYSCLACDHNLLWVDVEIVRNNSEISQPQEAIMCVVNYVLWHWFFPAIAVDNEHLLTYLLFVALEALQDNSVTTFLGKWGFSPQSRHIRLYTKEAYLTDAISFYFITTDFTSMRQGALKDIKELITFQGDQVVLTEDDSDFPRYYTHRKYYQPFNKTYRSDNSDSSLLINLKKLFTICRALIKNYASSNRGLGRAGTMGTSGTTGMNFITLFNDPSISKFEDFCNVITNEIHYLRGFVGRSPFSLGDNFTGSLEVRRKRPFIFVRNLIDQEWTKIHITRPVVRHNFDLPIAMLYRMIGIQYGTLLLNLPNPVRTFELFRNYQVEGIKLGNVLAYTIDMFLKPSDDEFNKSMRERFAKIAKSDVFSAVIRELASQLDMELGQAFKTVINNNRVVTVDMRALGYKIAFYDYTDINGIPIGENSSYFGTELQLSNSYFQDMINVSKLIFQPSTTPIEMPSRGLIISRQVVDDLDPDEYIDLVHLLTDHNFEYLIYQWSSEFLTLQESNTAQTPARKVLLLRRNAAENLVFTCANDVLNLNIKIIFIFSQYAETLSQSDWTFLREFINLGVVYFYLPDLYVNRVIVESFHNITDDILKLDDVENILKFNLDSFLTIPFARTTSDRASLGLTTKKVKFFFLIHPVSDRNIVIRGMIDQFKNNNNDLRVANFSMFAAGDGGDNNNIVYYLNDKRNKTIRFDDHEQSTGDDALVVSTVSKLGIGQANFCNRVTVFTDNQSFDRPNVYITDGGFSSINFGI